MTENCREAERAGILIVGHGTRDERGCVAFAQVVRDVAAQRSDALVEGCFLELVEPDIAGGIARVVERGAERVAVVPLLLVAAGHARRDVPRQIAAAAERYPHVLIHQTPHLGSHPALLELSARRFRSAVGEQNGAAEPVLLVVVGRGTKDPEANAELRRFAHERQKSTPTASCETCFLSMAEPSLTETLERAAESPCETVIVQPHFLFHGELLDRIQGEVAEAAQRAAAKRFIVADCLGPDQLLVQAIVDLAD